MVVWRFNVKILLNPIEKLDFEGEFYDRSDVWRE